MQYATQKNSKLSIEGFLKLYDNYPFLLNDSISFANLGGDFGVIGNDIADDHFTQVINTTGTKLLKKQYFSKVVFQPLPLI